MGEFDTFYYTDAFISNEKTLSILSILSDSLYIFYLSPDYFLNPVQERWEEQKEQPMFKKAPIECKLITPIYHEKHLDFIRENR